MIITLQGRVPSKKNAYRYTSRGGYIPAQIASELLSLQVQARAQWRQPTLESAVIGAVFYVKDGASDLDNKLTAAIDVLVKAGVIRNDSIKRVKRISAEAVIVKDGEEWTEVSVDAVGCAA